MDALRKVELRLVGGHVALDLINSVAPRGSGGRSPSVSGQVDFLLDPPDLLDWAKRVRVIEGGEVGEIDRAWRTSPRLAADALEATIDIREAAYAVLAASLAPDAVGGPDPEQALQRLTTRWTAAAVRSRLVSAGDSGRVTKLQVGMVPGQLIPDRLAVAAFDLLCTVDIGQLRVCPTEEGGCGWLFIDRSRNGSRRWCAMADCGSQAKARRLTERRRRVRSST